MAKIGIASYEEIKEQTLRIARGEHRPSDDEPRTWYTPQAAASRIEKLETALNQCAAPFRIGDQSMIDYEGIAREFNRRQKIAKAALEQARAEE